MAVTRPTPVSALLADSAFAHAQVLAGARGLSRVVEGVAMGEPGRPTTAFRDALMLAGSGAPVEELMLLVRQAAAAGAAAFVFVEPTDGAALDPATLSRANEAGLPVIALPRRTDWDALARAANRLLLSGRRQDGSARAVPPDGRVPQPGGVNGLVRRLCMVAGEEASALYWRTIGPIDLYDRQHGAALVDTLSVFFSWDESVERTAEALVAHRHTIRYRLGRIADITGLSPYRTSDKALLWLGLQLRDLLRTGAGLMAASRAADAPA